jgi:polysaccharide export outer membrane protein
VTNFQRELYLPFQSFQLLRRSFKVLLLILAGPVALSGCAASLLSGAGPSYRTLVEATESDTVAFEIIELSASTIGPYMLEEPSVDDSLVTGGVLPITLAPGDVLTVMLAQTDKEPAIFAALSGGGTRFTEVRVDHNGNIEIPYVGQIRAQGLTTVALAERIKKRVEPSLKSPEVRVTLSSDISGSVLVSGAVKTPGRYSAIKGPLTLLDVITRAGGATAEPHLINVTIRQPSGVQRLIYQDVLYGQNMVLSPRSEVVLQRNRQSFIAMGAVSTPGLFDLPSSHPSLLQVLGVVGGLQQATADPAGVFVFRRGGVDADGKPIAKVFRLDMARPEAMLLASAFQVQSEDALYVTNAGVYEAQKIIAPIVQMIILGNTVTGN